MPVADWVKRIVEDTAPPLRIGGRYLHPEDGAIEIVSGEYWGNHGLSNFWRWRVEATGEIHHGYGDSRWPEVP